MKKLKNITATEALRLMRLGFTDSEIIEADSQVSESASSVLNKKQKKQSVNKERQKKAEVINEEDITAKEILKKIEEIKEKHSAAVKKVDAFLNKSQNKKADSLLEKKEIEIKTSTSSDIEDISQEDVDF